jgi:hypothetical protein
MRDYLSALEWSHFATFTTRVAKTPDEILRQTRRYIRNLERAAQGPVHWFGAVEETNSGQPHLHALIGGCKMLGNAEVQRPWKVGLSRIRVFDPDRGGIAYTLKQVAGEGEYGFRFPRDFVG